MRKLPVVFIIFMVFSYLYSQEEKETPLGEGIKIGVVDMDRVFQLYKKAQEAKERYEGELALLKNSVDSARAVFEQEKKKFEEQKLMLSEKARTVKLEELKRKEEQFNRFVRDIFGEGGKADIKRNEIIEPVMREIAAKIREIAEDEKISIVFDISKGNILYSLPSLDITMRVVEELNKEYEEITVPQIKRKIAVLYIFPQDRVSENENLNTLIENYIKSVLNKKKSKFEIASSAEITQAYDFFQNKKDHVLSMDEAIEIGNHLQADLVFYGEVKKIGKNIIIRINLVDVSLRQNYGPKELKVQEEELQKTVGNTVIELLAAAGKE